jgi:hypothetical protein
MRLLLHPRRVLAIALMIPLAICGRSVAAEGFSAASFEKEMARLEGPWKAGKHVEYFLEAENVVERFGEAGENAGDDLMRGDKERARCGVRPLQIMLTRKLRVADFLDYCLADERNDFLLSSACDLSAMCQLAWWITPRTVQADEYTRYSPVPVESRATNLTLVADLLGRLRSEIVPNYRDGVQYLNVLFPFDTGNGFGFSGMDPEDMKNRVSRMVGKAVVRENVAAGALNNRQHWLGGRTPGSYCARQLFDAVVYVLRERKDRSALLAECAKRARLTAAEVKDIKKRLEAEDRRQPDPP